VHPQDFIVLKRIKISIFSGISKFLKLIVCRQILTNFGSFGLFWVDSGAMAVVDNMPHLKGKKKIVITFAKSVRILHVMTRVLFLAPEYVSKQVRVVPSINRPTRVNPSVF
jgi:hypothetical protein